MSPSVVSTQHIALGDVTPNNVGQLRKLHSVLFPVFYGDKFYDEVLQSGELSKLAYYNDVCVGAVCCRKSPENKIYMMTLGVLKSYRHLGIGRALLEHILEQAKHTKLHEVELHVQTANEQALAFYQANGFKITGTEKDYYRHIEPRDAHNLSITVSSPANGASS